MERAGRGLSRPRRGRELMALIAELMPAIFAVTDGRVVSGEEEGKWRHGAWLSALTCGPHTSVTGRKKKCSAYRSALGELMLGRCARGREGKKGRARWAGPEGEPGSFF